MVNFVAIRPVNIIELGVLGHLADSGPAKILQKSSHGFTVHQGADLAEVDFVVDGSNIGYYGGVPISGKITDCLVKVDGENAYKFSGHFSVSEALSLFMQDDAMAAAKAVFRENDRMTGSDEADQLMAFDGNDTVKGQDGDDELRGGKGNDKLFGGVGEDDLTGQQGKDQYYFNTAIGSEVDRVTDFNVNDDRIMLDMDVFTAFLSTGKLAAAAFRVAAAATEADDRIIYDSANGDLYYDEDGVDGVDAVLFARLDDGLNLAAGDFTIVA